jgi:hypothetical protein
MILCCDDAEREDDPTDCDDAVMEDDPTDVGHIPVVEDL